MRASSHKRWLGPRVACFATLGLRMAQASVSVLPARIGSVGEHSAGQLQLHRTSAIHRTLVERSGLDNHSCCTAAQGRSKAQAGPATAERRNSSSAAPETYQASQALQLKSTDHLVRYLDRFRRMQEQFAEAATGLMQCGLLT